MGNDPTFPNRWEDAYLYAQASNGRLLTKKEVQYIISQRVNGLTVTSSDSDKYEAGLVTDDLFKEVGVLNPLCNN